MITKKWWIAVVTSGTMAAALLAAPGISLAHSLPSAALHHQPNQAAKSDSAIATLTGQIKTGSHRASLVTSSGTTYTLLFGPPWFAAQAFSTFNGTTATVQGHMAGHALHVSRVNGKALRGKGKPPWAGMHGGGNGHG